MKFYSFKVKIRDKNTQLDKILELLKISSGNNITNLNYNKITWMFKKIVSN